MSGSFRDRPRPMRSRRLDLAASCRFSSRRKFSSRLGNTTFLLGVTREKLADVLFSFLAPTVERAPDRLADGAECTNSDPSFFSATPRGPLAKQNKQPSVANQTEHESAVFVDQKCFIRSQKDY